MRSLFALAMVAGVLGCGPTLAADPEKVGSLVQVPVKDGEKEVEAKVGDVLQFELGYAVVPDKMVSMLKLELSGKGLTHVATVQVPKRAKEGEVVVGVMAIAGFVRADKAGEYTVKIVPRLANGKDGDKAEFKVKVAKE
jgi:hypothetical protein